MVTILIILGCVIIPPIINLFYAYVIVKYRLWNWVSDMVLFDMSSSHKIDKISLKMLIVPILSLMSLAGILILYIGWIFYKIIFIVLWPFINFTNFVIDFFSKSINDITKKNEIYDGINNIKLKR